MLMSFPLLSGSFSGSCFQAFLQGHKGYKHEKESNWDPFVTACLRKTFIAIRLTLCWTDNQESSEISEIK